MTITTKNVMAGLVTASAASLCCITPLIALVGGAGGVAASFSFIEPYRPYLIAVTILAFAFAWYAKLKPQKQTDCECETKKSFIQSKLFLAAITLLAPLMTALPYYSTFFTSKPAKPAAAAINRNNIQQIKFTITGMSCEACTEHVNAKIARITGVISYVTSYANAAAVVRFDNSKTSIERIKDEINTTGYKVTSQIIMKD
jgi:mercuric ion transport protein